MNFAAADAIAKAVLYEGYALYPYRPSSIKNRQRWTFGGVYATGDGDAGPATLTTECLVEGDDDTRIEIRLRFLHLVERRIGTLDTPLEAWTDGADPAFTPVASARVGDRAFHSWDEAVERDVAVLATSLGALARAAASMQFAFDGRRWMEPLVDTDGRIPAVIARRQIALCGAVTVDATRVDARTWRIAVRVDNATPRAADEDGAQHANPAPLRALLSTHVLMGVEGGAFVSMLDPPERLADAVAQCRNQGAWPVLVGDAGSRDTLLASPIILYDHPRIAPESAGDLFDGTEIDEILTLRILTMTEAEKREMAESDERARALLERIEATTPEQLQRLHGAIRDLPPLEAPGDFDALVDRGRHPQRARANALRVGDRVRLHPKAGGDIFDLALADQVATVEAIERDYENRIHVAVTLDDDPGRDLGTDRMPGHRFFFSTDEVELLSTARARA